MQPVALGTAMEQLLTAGCLAFGGDGGLAFAATPLGGDGLGFDLLTNGVLYMCEASAESAFPGNIILLEETN